MRRRIAALVVVFALLFGAMPYSHAQAPQDGPPALSLTLATNEKAITLNEKKRTLAVGDTLQLVATVTPQDAPQDVRWKSSKPKCATVDENGLVTALKKGSAVITATDTKGKRARVKLSVVVPVTGLELRQESLVLARGKSKKLSAAVLPSTRPIKS